MDKSRIDELKRLIEESKQRINSKMALINKNKDELKLKQDELKRMEEHVKLLKTIPPKILTRKEIEEQKQLEILEFFEKEKKEKLEAELNTQKAFKKASELRENAKSTSEEEKKSTEISALQIECEALEKELKIRKENLREKEELIKDALVKKIAQEVKITRRKDELHRFQNGSNKEQKKLSELKERVTAAKSAQKDAEDVYKQYQKDYDEEKIKADNICFKLKERYENLHQLN